MLERGSILIFTFQNIPVRVHWTFGLLLFWVWYIGVTNGMAIQAILVMGLIILCLFACVVMHEFGHALAAKRFGITTRDIILSPIGGIARLDRIPERPRHELIVAIWGPMVNLVIAGVLGFITWVWGDNGLQIVGQDESDAFRLVNILPILFWMNLMLVVFNMIPAFPMDGGRVLRALLAWKFGRLKATKWAANIGRGLAILFVILAIYESHLFLGLIGLFVFVMATQEYKFVKTEYLYRRLTVGDVMRTRYTVLAGTDSVASAWNALSHGLEAAFPVGNPGEGIQHYILAESIRSAIASGHEGAAIDHFVRPITQWVDMRWPLSNLLSSLQQDQFQLIAVKDELGQLTGFIDKDQIDHALYWHMKKTGSY